MESDNTLAIIAIVIGLIALIGLAYVYVDEPETTDLSGVESDIISVKSDVRNLDRSVKSLSENILDIDTDCECDVDDEDLDDLESDLKRYCRDKVEEECDCDNGIDGKGLDEVKTCAIDAQTDLDEEIISRSLIYDTFIDCVASIE